jgi:hypothetical protein
MRRGWRFGVASFQRFRSFQLAFRFGTPIAQGTRIWTPQLEVHGRRFFGNLLWLNRWFRSFGRPALEGQSPESTTPSRFAVFAVL